MLESLLSNWPSLLLTVMVALGSLWVFRRAYVKQLGEMQEKVIATYKAQNEAQERQIQTCEKEIDRLKRIVATVQLALKRRGLRIEINGSSITLIDSQTKETRTTTMKMVKIDKIADEDEDEQEETP